LETLSKAYGVAFLRIENGPNLKAQLQKALAHAGPLLCEVVVMREEPRIPRVASKQLPDGKMVSSPLEDLFPFLPREELQRNMLIPLLDE
jgi:acetolactate synthase-1/2/3 large subunit